MPTSSKDLIQEAETVVTTIIGAAFPANLHPAPLIFAYMVGCATKSPTKSEEWYKAIQTKFGFSDSEFNVMREKLRIKARLGR